MARRNKTGEIISGIAALLVVVALIVGGVFIYKKFAGGGGEELKIVIQESTYKDGAIVNGLIMSYSTGYDISISGVKSAQDYEAAIYAYSDSANNFDIVVNGKIIGGYASMGDISAFFAIEKAADKLTVVPLYPDLKALVAAKYPNESIKYDDRVANVCDRYRLEIKTIYGESVNVTFGLESIRITPGEVYF